jgi:hypothetical protein
LSETEIWELKDATPTAKLYLLALHHCDEPERARCMASLPHDEVAVLEAWLLARSYAYRTLAPPAALAA